MQVEFPAVEVAGEANPLTEGLLYHALRSASSTDPTQIQTGTKQLQTWQTARGFYPMLQAVFADKSLSLEVRYLAVIQLKNAIDKYWRKTAPNAVDKEDKNRIRAALIPAGINEADHRLALQNALVIAKIVRIEFPQDWPDVFSQLLQTLRASSDPNVSPLQLPRALLILLHVVKELATGRLLRSQKNLQAVTPETLNVLGSIYVNKVQRWQAFCREGAGDEGGALDDLKNALMAIKIIRRLLISGYEFPSREKDVQDFWTLTHTVFNDFGQQVLGENSPLTGDPRIVVEKHMMQLAKLHVAMASSHPSDFVLLPGSLNLVQHVYWSLITQLGQGWRAPSLATAVIASDGDAEDEKPILERLALKGLVLIRACTSMVFYPAKTFRYRQQQEKEERTRAIETVKAELLTENLVREMLFTLVKEFFSFRPSDLRMWEEEPDEWEKMEEGGEDWEFAIRPCAEKLFLDLAKNFKSLIIKPLMEVFHATASLENEDVLFKDAIYNAIGLAADILVDYLDIDAFVKNVVVAEVQKQQPGFNIIRRRIAIVLSQWITISMKEETKPLVYQIYQHLLDRSDPLNDQIVRVTAGRRFYEIANEWEFKADTFMPYAPLMLDRLMSLVQEVELAETKMALLNTISAIITRMEHHITPYANNIVSILPPLWEQSGNEHLMKQAILTMLTGLTNAMKVESRPFHISFLPIIQSAIEPGSEMQVYLLEDALDLWSSIIAQTPSAPEQPPAQLLELIRYLLPLYALDNETLRKSLEITEAYLLLSPATVLADDFRPQLLAALAALLGTLQPEANGTVTHLVQYVIRGAEMFGGQQAVKIVADDLVSTGFLQKVLEGLHGAWEHHQSHGPSRELPARAVDGVVETDYFTVLARIGVASPTVLLETLSSVSGGSDIDWLLQEWFSHIDNIGNVVEKKLMALALTRLLETNGPFILGHLQDLIIMWTTVLGELLDGMDDNTADSLYWVDGPSAQPTEPEAPEDVRRRELYYTDAVHSTNLVPFVRDHLQQAIQGAGGEGVFQEEWLSRVDKDVLKGFTDLGIM